MPQKSLFIAVVTCLFLTGCPLGLNETFPLFKIVQVGDTGIDGVVYPGHTIQLEITPAELSDTVYWSLQDSEHSVGMCAEVDQTGMVSGSQVCETITVVAQSQDGAADYFPLKVQLEKHEEIEAVDKPIDKTG